MYSIIDVSFNVTMFTTYNEALFLIFPIFIDIFIFFHKISIYLLCGHPRHTYS